MTSEHKITHSKNFSSIFIKKKIHMIFGTLEDVSDEEKIRIALNEFKKYFTSINDFSGKICVSWREAQKYDWCFSDDFRIVQILVRNNTPPKADTTGSFNKGYVRTCVGVFPINPTCIMDTRFELHPNRYAIGQSKKDFNERIKDRDQLTAKEEVFCTYVANGMKPDKAYKETFKTNNVYYSIMSSNRLLQQERIQSSISDEVERILTEEGVSKSYIVSKYKQLVDDGLLDMKNCSSSVRAALRDLSEISNMFPSKDKSIAQISSNMSEITDDKLMQIKEKKAMLLGMSKKVEITNDRLSNNTISRLHTKDVEVISYTDEDGFNELLV